MGEEKGGGVLCSPLAAVHCRDGSPVGLGCRRVSTWCQSPSVHAIQEVGRRQCGFGVAEECRATILGQGCREVRSLRETREWKRE